MWPAGRTHCSRHFTLLRKCRAARLPATRRVAAACSNIREIREQLSGRKRSAAEITEDWLTAAHAQESAVKSFITLDAEGARKQAQALDERLGRENGASPGPLAGVPVAVKDNICTQSLQTTAGSRILEGYIPPYDATAVARLRHAGAVVVGKTNLDAFGMGSTTEYSDYHLRPRTNLPVQSTCNPWDLERVPGGSSGGSAAAVAAGQCAAALGSDTGGSIRQPASFCGCVGLKPTYGRVSRFGLVAYASSLDCVGPLASCVEDAAIVFDVIAGHDIRDATTSKQPASSCAAGLQPREQLSSKPLQGKRIGIIAESLSGGLAPGVKQSVGAAIAHLEALGADVSEVHLPSLRAGLPAYYVIALSEASSNLARYDGVRYGLRRQEDQLRSMYRSTRAEGLGDEQKRRILMGTYALSAGYVNAYYTRAQQVRTLVQREFKEAAERFDCLVSPVAPSVAYKLGEKVDDPLGMYKGDLMTTMLNLAGLPGISVPCGFDDEAGHQPLPVGLQLIGRAFGEADLLKMAHIFEQTSDLGRQHRPPLLG